MTEATMMPAQLQHHNVEGRPLMKFVLLVGQAVAVNRHGEARIYHQGMRIETPTNLERRFGGDKFRRISDGDNVDEGLPMSVNGYSDGSFKEMIDEINKDDQYVRDQQALAQLQQEGNAPEQASGEELYNEAGNSATYNAMSLDELFKLAGEEEIPLGSAKTKKDVIKKIIDFERAVAVRG